MKLLLIAGHGAGDPGAVSTISGKEYREADETRRVVAALQKALADYCEVTTYPTDRNAYYDYEKGTLGTVANFSSFDYALEVHFNASSYSPADGITKGVECYVPTGATSTTTEAALCAAVAGRGFENRGVKKYNWAVINRAHRSGTPAALLEVCFIDDPDDVKVYTARFQAIVDALAGAIISQFKLTKKEDTMTGEEIYNTLNAYLATLPVPAWAEKEFAEAKALGITDGSNPMQMIPRYQAAIMSLRAKKGK